MMRRSGSRRTARWVLPVAVGLFAGEVCLFSAAAGQPASPNPGAAGQTTGQTATPMPPAVTGILRVRSDPPGAVVTLIGEHRWRGTTPWDVDRGLTGPYDVRAELSGYERWRREISLTEGEARELTIRLTPKSRWKATARDLLVPGWGQFYADRPTKGTLIFLGTALAAGGLAWAHEDYENRVDDFDRARSAYLSATRLEDLDALRAQLDSANRRADRAYDRQKILLYATGGFYALGVIDALFLFPERALGSFASVEPLGKGMPRVALQASPAGDVRLALLWDRAEGGRP